MSDGCFPDDELGLLKLLAERERLNASDYLRASLRRSAASPAQITQAMRIVEILGAGEATKVFAARGPKRKTSR
ncbi:hypothetical protein BH09MYX1_BH09MYX1_15890 [soil metagenome]